MIEVDRTYTLPGAETVYLAETLPDGSLFLRDLNRSYFWRCVRDYRQGWLEGYLVTAGLALAQPQRGEVRDGAYVWQPLALAPQPLGAFVGCGVKRQVGPLGEQRGRGERERG